MEPVENNQSHGKNGIIRLLEISGEKKWWLVLSVVLAAASTVMQIVPYIASYKIIRIYISAGMNGTDVNGDDVFFLCSFKYCLDSHCEASFVFADCIIDRQA